eukprot:jgi/Chrzof1/10462/UNPLg00389.t1
MQGPDLTKEANSSTVLPANPSAGIGINPKRSKSEACPQSRKPRGMHISRQVAVGTAVGGLLALATGALTYTLYRFTRKQKQCIRRMTGELQAKDRQLRRVTSELAETRQQLQEEVKAAQQNLRSKTLEYEQSKVNYERMMSDLQQRSDQLHSELTSTVAMTQSEAEAKCKEAHAQREECERKWKQAYNDLMTAQVKLEQAQGEIFTTKSAMEMLTRELEHTKRQLLNAEKRVEQAHHESRQSRSSYGTGHSYTDWD